MSNKGLLLMTTISLAICGCVTNPDQRDDAVKFNVPGRLSQPGQPSRPNQTSNPSDSIFSFLDVEGYVIHYRDLSDPCDPGSTPWSNPHASQQHQESIDCDELVTDTILPADERYIPDTDYVLMFALRGKTLRSPENDALLEELAMMRDWPVRYQVFGAAGGMGDTLETLGIARANVVRQGLVDAGIPDSKIAIMPYDPTIPGLRAVVRLAEEES